MTIEAFAAALVHSLWQGAVLAAFVWALCLPPGRSAAVRCRLALVGLGALALMVVGTAWLIAAETAAALSGDVGPARTTVSLSLPLRAAAEAASRFDAFRADLPLAARWIVIAWAVVALLLLVRLVLGAGAGWSWRVRGRAAPPEIVSIVARMARRAGTRTPDVVRTSHVDVPGAVGCGPAILLPLSFPPDLPEVELEALLAHELAHVRRRDWAMNLLQSALDALLWFHPAARWMSARARTEREFACDDIAARLCGGPLPVARALVRLEAARPARPPRPAGAVASAARGPLLDRIQRLVVVPGSSSRAPSPLTRRAAWLPAGLALTLAAWTTVGVLPAAAMSRLGIATIRAVDDAGPFTLSFLEGQALGATIDGVALSSSQLRQTADSVYFLDGEGAVRFAVRVKPEGGIAWDGRPARPGDGNPVP